jgi:hypothetical protein
VWILKGKCEGGSLLLGQTTTVSCRANKPDWPVRGNEAFVWTSETQEGAGLAALGIVTRSDSVQGHVEVFVTALPARELKNDHLKPYRDSGGSQPIEKIANRLYFHSHHKAIALCEPTGDWLREYFIE